MSEVLPMDRMSEGTYIRFIWCGVLPGRKTGSWSVETRDGEAVLGKIKWFARWRKYAFFPLSHCVFEETCMCEIGAFINERTKVHRGALSISSR